MPAFMSIYTGNTISGVMSGLDLGANSCYQPHTHTPIFVTLTFFLNVLFAYSLALT